MEIEYYKQYEPIFGAWRITRLIGEGSFGKVFEIEREDFGVTYKAALKAITVPTSESEMQSALAEGMDEESARTYFGSFVQELVREFAIMSKLKGNSNVVSYENHQVIEHKEGIGWDILIQMELLTPLNAYIKEHKRISRQEVIRMGIDLCKALELCQKHNIIHRDIKPENIFVSENGDFKLGDFGIARTVGKSTNDMSKKGTYGYMAPEVYKGEQYDSTVDIYSLGLVLYRMLNGNRLPFYPAAPAPITYADRENAMIKRLSNAPMPMPCHAEGRLAEIVLKACAYHPKERYSSPMQMRQELEAILYNREEAKIIYPNGDEVPQDSAKYFEENANENGGENEGTASRFGGKEKSEAELILDFDEKNDAEEKEESGTVSNFGKKKTESQEKKTDENKAKNDGKKKTENAPKQSAPQSKKKNRMILIAVITAVVVIAAICIGIGTSGKKQKTLIFALPELEAPVSYSDGYGNALGYYKDVCNALANTMGYQADFLMMDDARTQAAVMNGTANLSISWELSGFCYYSSAWEQNEMVFLTADSEKAASITKEGDLSEYLIGYVTGSLEAEMFRRSNISSVSVEVDSLDEALAALRSGGFDFLLINAQTAQEIVEEFPEFTMPEFSCRTPEYFFASLENEELINEVIQAIAKLQESGMLDSLRDRYRLLLQTESGDLLDTENSSATEDTVRIGVLAPAEYGRTVFEYLVEQNPTVDIDGINYPIKIVMSDAIVGNEDRIAYCEKAAEKFIDAGCVIVCEIWGDEHQPTFEGENRLSEMLKNEGIPLLSYCGWNENGAYGINSLNNSYPACSLSMGIEEYSPQSVGVLIPDLSETAGKEAYVSEIVQCLEENGITEGGLAYTAESFLENVQTCDMIYIYGGAADGSLLLRALKEKDPEVLYQTAILTESSEIFDLARELGYVQGFLVVQQDYDAHSLDFGEKFRVWLNAKGKYDEYMQMSTDDSELIRDTDFVNASLFETAIRTIELGGDLFENLEMEFLTEIGIFHFQPSTNADGSSISVFTSRPCVLYRD